MPRHIDTVLDNLPLFADQLPAIDAQIVHRIVELFTASLSAMHEKSRQVHKFAVEQITALQKVADEEIVALEETSSESSSVTATADDEDDDEDEDDEEEAEERPEKESKTQAIAEAKVSESAGEISIARLRVLTKQLRSSEVRSVPEALLVVVEDLVRRHDHWAHEIRPMLKSVLRHFSFCFC